MANESTTETNPAFLTFVMPANSPRSGTFGCFEETLDRYLAMHRSTLLGEAVAHCDGYDRGFRTSHWRGVKKSDLARFVASMKDGAPVSVGEALRIRAERKAA